MRDAYARSVDGFRPVKVEAMATDAPGTSASASSPRGRPHAPPGVPSRGSYAWGNGVGGESSNTFDGIDYAPQGIDRPAVSPTRPRSAPYVDTTGRDAYFASANHYTAPGSPRGASIAGKSTSRDQGAAALLQQHAANQWAFRANQAALPVPMSSAPPLSSSTMHPLRPDPVSGNGGSHGRRSEFLLPPLPPNYVMTAQVSYTPYGYGPQSHPQRPPLAPHEHSSSGSSTSASTPAGLPGSASASSHSSSGPIGRTGETRARSGSTSEGLDFGQSFYDPFRIKQRRRTSPAQLRVLEHHFERTPKPDLTLRKRLGEHLDMTPREVQVWFQNRRAKVKKLQERADRAATTQDDGASSSVPDKPIPTRSRSGQAPTTGASSQPRPGSSHSSGDPRSLTGKASSGSLPDEASAYPTPPIQPPPDHLKEELRLPLPPRDYFQQPNASSSRRYSLPAFAQSVIPPTPLEEPLLADSGLARNPVGAYGQSLTLPSDTPPLAYGTRPSMFASVGSNRQDGENSPSGSVSSRASDLMPASIPEHNEVSSWSTEAVGFEDGAGMYPVGSRALAARRASAPAAAMPIYQNDDSALQASADGSLRPPTSMPWAPAGVGLPATAPPFNPAVYPAPTSLIDPVGSVVYAEHSGGDPMYDYANPYMSATGTGAESTLAPAFVHAGDVGPGPPPQ
ncbi:hypothetical protein JCM8202_005915 [Rhodotorula sphaerocarpa]